MDIRVSIIIPTYKPQIYLLECLSSIKVQTIGLEGLEIIIVLNGEREPFYSKIFRYIDELDIREYANLLYCSVPGVSNARNLALEKAKGEYVCFIDDDDVISPSYIDSLLSVSSVDCVGCTSSVSFFDTIDDTKPNFITGHYFKCKGKPFNQFRFRGFLSPPFCKLIHRDILNRVRFDCKVSIGEDSLFCLGLVPRIKNMKLADERAVYYYRQRPESAIHKHSNRKDVLTNFFYAEIGYLRHFLRNPLSYNLFFLLSRMGGAFYIFLRRFLRI